MYILVRNEPHGEVHDTVNCQQRLERFHIWLFKSPLHGRHKGVDYSNAHIRDIDMAGFNYEQGGKVEEQKEPAKPITST